MKEDKILQSLGELKGMVKAHDEKNEARYLRLSNDVRSLQNIHQRLRGAIYTISVIVGFIFHGIVKWIETKIS